MKKFVWPFLIGLLVLIGAGSMMMRGGKKEDDSKKKESITVELGDIQSKVVETGTIDAIKSVDVKSRVTGRVKQILVEEGQSVIQGQLIAIIDPKETQLVLDQNEAQLRGAQRSVQRSSLEVSQRGQQARVGVDSAKVRIRQLMLELESQPKLNQASIDEAQTAVNTANAEKRRLIESSQPNLRRSTESQVLEAKANVRASELEFARQQELESKGFSARRAVELSRQNVDVAKARLAQAEEAAARLEASLSVEINKVDQQIAQSQAALSRAKTNLYQIDFKRQELESAKVDLRKAETALLDPAILEKQQQQSMAVVDQLSSVVSDARRQLSETEIRAPITGVVTKKGLQVGELATGLSSFSSGTTIVKIEDRTTMRVRLDINEIDTAKLDLGMDAKIVVDALPKASLVGKVTKIAPASKEAANGVVQSSDAVVKYQVEITLSNSDPGLRSGMSAKCSLIVINKKGVVRVPLEYVAKEEDGSYIMLAGAKPTDPGTKKKITVGTATGTYVEVTGGLKQGDKIVRPDFNGPKRVGAMQFGGDNQ